MGLEQKDIVSINWNFPSSNRKASIHNLHPYPAKFIPEIPEGLIKKLGVIYGGCVFDPFCGSGTTLIEAQKLGYESIGVDINPIACLASRVKTTPLKKDLVKIASLVVKKSRSIKVYPKDTLIPNVDHWFKPEIINTLAALTKSIKKVEGRGIRNALELALSSVVVTVSNQESDTRYAAVVKKVASSDVYDKFTLSVKKIFKEVSVIDFQRARAKVIQRNILETVESDIKKPVGLVITSPPYPNAYEYWLYHKYRMYWLGHNPIEVKNKEIGARAHYFKKNHATIDDFKVQMKYVLSLIYSISLNGAYTCFVVGRSKIHGKIHENYLIIEEIGKELGFVHEETIVRTISASRKSFNLSHASIKTEQIVILRKP